jgi:hypothetical protein
VDCWCLSRRVSSRLLRLLANLCLCGALREVDACFMISSKRFLRNCKPNILTMKCYALHLLTLGAVWNTAERNIRPTKHSQFLKFVHPE